MRRHARARLAMTGRAGHCCWRDYGHRGCFSVWVGVVLWQCCEPDRPVRCLATVAGGEGGSLILVRSVDSVVVVDSAGSAGCAQQSVATLVESIPRRGPRARAVWCCWPWWRAGGGRGVCVVDVVVAGGWSRSRAARRRCGEESCWPAATRKKKVLCSRARHGASPGSVAKVGRGMADNASIGESYCYRLNECTRIDAIWREAWTCQTPASR